MADLMTFPTTVEEFMDKYKITDTEQIYTNGADLVPVFRMKQWFEHADFVSVVRCKDCMFWKTETDPIGIECEPGETAHYCDIDGMISRSGDFCSYGERKDNED